MKQTLPSSRVLQYQGLSESSNLQRISEAGNIMAREGSLTSALEVEWPKEVQDWIRRSFDKCEIEEIDVMERLINSNISEAKHKSTFSTIDWKTHPLPLLPREKKLTPTQKAIPSLVKRKHAEEPAPSKKSVEKPNKGTRSSLDDNPEKEKPQRIISDPAPPAQPEPPTTVLPPLPAPEQIKPGNPSPKKIIEEKKIQAKQVEPPSGPEILESIFQKDQEKWDSCNYRLALSNRISPDQELGLKFKCALQNGNYVQVFRLVTQIQAEKEFADWKTENLLRSNMEALRLWALGYITKAIDNIEVSNLASLLKFDTTNLCLEFLRATSKQGDARLF